MDFDVEAADLRPDLGRDPLGIEREPPPNMGVQQQFSRRVEYAELQALGRKSMSMRDWITKLDEFLKSNRSRVEAYGA